MKNRLGITRSSIFAGVTQLGEMKKRASSNFAIGPARLLQDETLIVRDKNIVCV